MRAKHLMLLFFNFFPLLWHYVSGGKNTENICTVHEYTWKFLNSKILSSKTTLE